MRLINVATMELEEYGELDRPKYAILSHAWGKGEVLFGDWPDARLRRSKVGYRKISLACKQAKKDGLEYLWVDTNCIDKTSSAELSEAINSMYAWYRDSEVCYAFLEDVPRTNFENSRWFTRGWTLQELLAPRNMIFYSGDWEMIGDKWELALTTLQKITRVSGIYLRGTSPVTSASVAERMSWVSNRTTTRIEDMAYCMLGIFDINIPLLYGEGSKAFIRLQEEIIRVSNDQSIFSWKWNEMVPRGWVSMLAPSASAFAEADSCWRPPQDDRRPVTYTNTNAGLSIRLPIIRTWSYYLAVLNTQQYGARVAIPVQGSLATGVLERVPVLDGPVQVDASIKALEYDVFIPRDKGDQLFAPLRRPLYKSGALVCFDGTHQYKKCSSYPRNSFDETTSIFRLDSRLGFLKLKTNVPEVKRFVILFERRGTQINVSVMPDRFVDMDETSLARELERIENSQPERSALPYRRRPIEIIWGRPEPTPERVSASVSPDRPFPGKQGYPETAQKRVSASVSPVRPFLGEPDIVMVNIRIDGSQRKDVEDDEVGDWDSDIAEPGFMIQ